MKRRTAQSTAYHNIDWLLLACILVMLSFGLLMVLSAGSVVGERDFHDKYYF